MSNPNMTVRQFLAIAPGERPTMMDAEILWNDIKELKVERDLLVDALREVTTEIDRDALTGHFNYLSACVDPEKRKIIVAERLREPRPTR